MDNWVSIAEIAEWLGQSKGTAQRKLAEARARHPVRKSGMRFWGPDVIKAMLPPPPSRKPRRHKKKQPV